MNAGGADRLTVAVLLCCRVGGQEPGQQAQRVRVEQRRSPLEGGQHTQQHATHTPAVAPPTLSLSRSRAGEEEEGARGRRPGVSKVLAMC